MAGSYAFAFRRVVRPAALLPIIRGPARVALSPLAWVLAAVDAAVRRPSLLAAATVVLICVPSGIRDVTTSGHVTAADVAAGSVVAVLAARIIRGDRTLTRRGWLPFAAAAAAFAVATVTAADVGTSVVGFVRYTELFVLVPVAVAMAIRDRADVLLIAGAIVVTTVLEGSVGVWQYATRTGASYAGQYIRAVGTFGPKQVLALGALVGYGLVVTLALGLAVRGRRRVLLLVTAALLMLPLGLSLSRGAWIATACAVLVMLILFSWRVTLALVGTAALVVAVLVVGGASPAGMIDQRVTSIVSSDSAPDRSVRDRYALWQAALDMWTDHPVVGVGMKSFAGYRDSYAPMSLSAGSDVGDPTSGVTREPLLSAHSQYLMVLSEQGTVGILAFGGLLAALSVGALRRRPRVLPPAQERFLDLVAPAVMVWTLVDLAYGDVGAGPTSALLAVVLGLAARRSLIIARPPGERGEVR